jgi:UDP-N-acetylglucosamine:LPS N-acetylglucosamine transferase
LGTRLTKRKPLRKLVVEGAPDAIVSVISDFGQLAVVPRLTRPQPPVITVISDLVTIHRGWLSPQADLLLVPTQPAYDACRRYKVPPEKLRLVGYPMRTHLFCRDASPRSPMVPGGLRILLMGGSSGTGRLDEQIVALAGAGLRLELIAVCGKNGRLQRRLAEMAPQLPAGVTLEVLGYTDQVPQLMQSADVLVTKAGPSTLFEAVACQLPAILTAHLPGQEGGNARFFEQAGVAVSSTSPAHTARLAAAFIADPSRLDRLRQPTLAAQTCAASASIAQIILTTARASR